MSAQHQQLSHEAARFRRLIIDRLWDNDRSAYLTHASFTGVCPVCGHAAAVHFHGRAPRATLICHGGCLESEIAARIGLEARP